PHATSLSRTASSSMAGAGAADYSGAHSKKTLNTTQEWMRSGGQVDTALTGSRHGKKIRSTPPGYTTTNTFGNGGLRHGDFAGVSEVATAPYTFAPIGSLLHKAMACQEDRPCKECQNGKFCLRPMRNAVC